MIARIARRQFVTALAGTAAAWPLGSRAQAPELPVIALINGGSAAASSTYAAAFRKGLGETDYVEGRNVTIEYHWLEGQFDRLRALMADLVRRRVAVIATPVSMAAALAAKAATSTTPIVFGISQDPVKFGLAISFPRPGGNATGINFLNREVDAKRLQLLHELVPRAVHIALLVNSANARANAETTVENLQEPSRAMGLQLEVVRAGTGQEIDAAFAGFAHERPDALVVTGDAFFTSRRKQLAELAARERIPAVYSTREIVEAGGLISYGSDLADTFYLVGLYAGRILKGAKPADLPVIQSAKFVLAINLKTARLLGVDVPRTLLALADDVIE
ncbi:MAG TPA: ABC transporter substrate-binding protein [Xanthobacteraceae bacterium]|jgi:putative ABC transport system substrate-binding protein